ncbi:bifunctional 3-demethylubiquinone-9 3-methyltransferase/ 2-octaprenyl-6-hydroxy phenol methylase [Actinomyces howellii]|uniref:Bifunctional 3-demethylubiquinone-9 3-methyltransferase/ 2-octaprenyl-6-hydroxy phenol methylase n=1 Tax=Actinomyces howellii TaxID=52771 RepID=A0A3S4V534_9ACTO|nr:bifunctional 3-demethylubiquinone-9 3-methyltransferase/ 2-octaprenyl-6-hydroxy phenol methylase [Actinomyces howellii]
MHPVDASADATPAPLHTGLGARRYHRLSLRDESEVATIVEILAFPSRPELLDKRVLELSCGWGRLTLPMAAAGHRVLATDVDSDALADLAEHLVPQDQASTSVELRLTSLTSFSFDETFKAVCLPTGVTTRLDRTERRSVMEAAVSHLAPGGVLIVSTDYVLESAPTTMCLALGPHTTLTEQILPETGLRRTTLSWEDELYSSDLHIVPPTWVSRTCTQLGLTVTYQRSKPDPLLTGRVNAVIAAVKNP